MKKITFITGNEGKTAELSRLLGFSLDHKKIELDEIQELDLEKLIRNKALSAFALIKSPVLVEDTSLTFEALGKMPGPFIKWFLKEMGNEGLCTLLNAFTNRRALFTSMFAYHDGNEMKLFSKSISGTISNKPKGNNGFGWDAIFIPTGATKTRAEMTHKEQDMYTARKLLIPLLKEFFKQK